MLPERSLDGLANEHLLHGVDAVVWTEGGDFSDSSTPPTRGDDVQFWRKVFEAASPNRRFHFKPYGSKTQVAKKAQRIADNALSGVVACLDRDHDDIANIQLSDSNVIYTQFYSWENEVWTPRVVLSVFSEIYAGSEIPARVVSKLDKAWRYFNAQMYRHVRADVFLSQHALPRRLSGLRHRLLAKELGFPVVRLDQIGTYRDVLRDRSKSAPIACDFAVNTHCVGHLIADFLYQMLREFVRTEVHTALPYDLARSMAVQAFSLTELQKSPASHYYQRVLAEIRL